MKIDYYRTDLGLVVVDKTIRLKTVNKRELSKEEFDASNPVKIKKKVYLQESNTYYRNVKHEWEYQYVKYKKLDNFELGEYEKLINYKWSDIPVHNKGSLFLSELITVYYKGYVYYTFLSGNYYPKMQLIDSRTLKLTNTWTHIKNLAPIFNKQTKQII